MVYLILIFTGILLLGLVAGYFIGRACKKYMEEVEDSMNEPMYDKRYEK